MLEELRITSYCDYWEPARACTQIWRKILYR